MIKVKFSFIIVYVILFALQLFINEKIFFTIFYGVTIIIIIELLYLIIIYGSANAEFVDNEITLRVKERKTIKISIHNKLSFPIFYLKLSYKIDEQEVESIIPDLFYRSNVTCDINMCFERRGEYLLENFQMSYMDFLNIFTFRKLINKKYKIKVYPVIKKLNMKVRYSSYAYSDESVNKGTIEDVIDIKNIRKYSSGDPIKKIHWKLSAKYNEFFVRDYNNISGRNQLMILNMNENDYGLNKSENDEEMISLLCSVIRLFFSKGQDVDLHVISNEVDSFRIKSYHDFKLLLAYFLKMRIGSGINFIDRIMADASYYKKYDEVFLFTPMITKGLITNLDKLNKVGITKYSIFHLGKSSLHFIESLETLRVKVYAFNDITL